MIWWIISAIIIVPPLINLLIGYIIFKFDCKETGRGEVTVEDFVDWLEDGYVPPIPFLFIPPISAIVTVFLVFTCVLCIPAALWLSIYDRIKHLKI